MTSKLQLLSLGLLSLTAMDTLKAQTTTLSGEIRPRTEFRNGFKKPITSGQESALFTEQRTRLNFKHSNDKFDVVMSVQDIRNWGAVSQIYKTDPSLFNLYEGYGTLKFDKKSAITVGRKALNYDNSRFLGSLAWAQQARSHDLALFTYKDSAFQFHAGVAFNQDANTPEFRKVTSTFYSAPNPVTDYKTMQFLWMRKDFSKATLSFLALNNGKQWGANTDSTARGVRFSQTLGLFLNKTKGDWKFTGEAYTQLGKAANDNQVEGYFVGASATYAKGKVPITLGFDYMSGDKSGTEHDGAFKPLFGTNHKFYGLMDYFYVGNGHMNKGLIDIYLKTKVKLADKHLLVAHLHNFSAAVDVMDPTDATKTMSAGLGTELDLVYVAKISKQVNFKLGYSQMFKTETMDVIKGTTGADNSYNSWAWAMLTFKPTFFSK